MDSSFFLHTRWGRGGLLIWPPLPTAMAVSSCALDVDMFPRRIFFNLLYSRKTMASLYLNYYIKKNISRKEQLSDKGCHFTNHISGLKRSPWYLSSAKQKLTSGNSSCIHVIHTFQILRPIIDRLWHEADIIKLPQWYNWFPSTIQLRRTWSVATSGGKKKTGLFNLCSFNTSLDTILPWGSMWWNSWLEMHLTLCRVEFRSLFFRMISFQIETNIPFTFCKYSQPLLTHAPTFQFLYWISFE